VARSDRHRSPWRPGAGRGDRPCPG
jgi:hypothetical protein